MFKLASALILSALFVQTSFAAVDETCTKVGHVGATKFEITSVRTQHVNENIVVQLVVKHLICLNVNGNYSWQLRSPLADYQRIAYPDGTYRMHFKRGEAYLGNPDFTTYQVLNLESSAEQTMTFVLPAVGSVLPHHKLHFFVKTYGRVVFSNGEVIDPAIDMTFKKVIDISK